METPSLYDHRLTMEAPMGTWHCLSLRGIPYTGAVGKAGQSGVLSYRRNFMRPSHRPGMSPKEAFMRHFISCKL